MKHLLRRLTRRGQSSIAFRIARSTAGLFIDYVQVDLGGIIRLLGRSKGDEFDAQSVPSVCLDKTPVPFLQSFRFRRQRRATFETLVALEYLVPQDMAGSATVLLIDLKEGGKCRFKWDFHFIVPHYRLLFDSREVLHRSDIYGSGPPTPAIHPETLALAKQLKGPLLDFGCGRGALISGLRRFGTEAFGLELNSAVIRESISPQEAPFITLYDGTFPSPLETGRFRSVICTEVLEHIPDYDAAIKDIARLAGEKVVFTVPDTSAIPVGFRHGVVPWHMLEGSHVNFFTQQSLRQALEPYFSKIEFGRSGLFYFYDSMYFVSLTATCWK